MDLRFIKNLEDYRFNLEKLESLKPAKFEMKLNNKKRLGVIAQKIEALEPMLVEKINGNYSVNYEALTVVLLSIVKDLNDRITVLENNNAKKKTK